MHVCMDGWMDGWMDAWIDRYRASEMYILIISSHIHIYICIYIYIYVYTRTCAFVSIHFYLFIYTHTLDLRSDRSRLHGAWHSAVSFCENGRRWHSRFLLEKCSEMVSGLMAGALTAVKE